MLQLTIEDDVSQEPLKPDITLKLNQLETLVPNQRGLKIANLNINSLFQHIDELRINMADQIIDILGINETKLDSSVPQYLISLEGYTWVSRDRNRFGGGVGFYIRNSINFQVRSDLIRTILRFLQESIILGNLNCDMLNKSLNFITNLYQCDQSLIDHFYSNNRKQNVVLAGVSRITISDHYLIYGIKNFLLSKESNDSSNFVTLKILMSKITCTTFLK